MTDQHRTLPPRIASPMTVTSYQFAPSSIQGWNDCPIIPRSVSSSSVNTSDAVPKRVSSTRKSRRPVYVNHLDHQNTEPRPTLSRTPSDYTSSSNVQQQPLPLPSTRSNNTSPVRCSSPLSYCPPPLAHQRSPSRLSGQTKPPSDEVRSDVKAKIDELINHDTNLCEEQYAYHKQRLEDASILSSNSNIVFLQTLLEAWNKSNKNINDTAVVNILYDFTSVNTDIAWLLSLKKLMSNIK